MKSNNWRREHSVEWGKSQRNDELHGKLEVATDREIVSVEIDGCHMILTKAPHCQIQGIPEKIKNVLLEQDPKL